MKNLKSFGIFLLLLGFAACQTIEEPDSNVPEKPNTEVPENPAPEPEPTPEPIPTAHLKFVGDWNFEYLVDSTMPDLHMTPEFIQLMGFPVNKVTLTIAKTETFKLNGIGPKKLEGTYAIQGEDLLMTLTPESYKQVQKQLPTENFLAKHHVLEGEEKVELDLGKLTISEVKYELNNTSMFFKK